MIIKNRKAKLQSISVRIKPQEKPCKIQDNWISSTYTLALSAFD